MIQELRNASSLLRSAIERYHSTCLTLRSQYRSDYTLTSLPDSEILDELEQIASCGAKIQESQKALGELRNLRRNIVPVNSLPAELLAHVFRLASQTERCFLENTTALLKYPSNLPTSLLYVCSYWRSVALASHDLWTHIDLIPYNVLSERLNPCVSLFAARAGQLPLDIHVNCCGPDTRIYCQDHLLELCALVAARARSIVVEYSSPFGSNVLPLIEELIKHCTIGEIYRLVIRNTDPSGKNIQTFIESNEAGEHNTFERVLSHVTVLRVDGIYPHWASQAYQMLTKLHLTDTTRRLIAISSLVMILQKSPGLRYLYLSFGGIKVDCVPNVQIHLESLEALHLALDTHDYGDVLRLIFPGSAPLRMSSNLTYDSNAGTLTDGEYGKFIARSNISQLYAYFEYCEAPLSLSKLLELAPSIRFLSLNGVNIESPSSTNAKVALRSQLAELRLAESFFSPDVVMWVAEAYPSVKITIGREVKTIYDGHEFYDPKLWEDQVLEKLPTVKFVDKIVPAGEDWD